MKQRAASQPKVRMPAGPLRHVDDRRPGYTRRPLRNGFAYYGPDGVRVRDADEIARINALAIPPAYTDVWICMDPRGHLQATGRDARGRKQYRYHPLWRDARREQVRADGRVRAFARALPRIRARVTRDLALPGMPRDKVVATIVRLLDTTLARIGNAEYARNGSFGLTTLRKRHLKIQPGQVRLRFAGKSGIEHDVTVDDARVARIVRRCAELPGHELFQYVDDDGVRHPVGSSDVNDLREPAARISPRRTTGLGRQRARARAVAAHRASRRHARAQADRRDRARGGRATAQHRPCAGAAIHPAVLDAFEAGTLALAVRRTPRGLRVDEAAFVALLGGARRRMGT